MNHGGYFMEKIKMQNGTLMLDEVIEKRYIACKVRGILDTTLKTYKQHMDALKQYLNVNATYCDFKQANMDPAVAAMCVMASCAVVK
jgi:hypothetical protein